MPTDQDFIKQHYDKQLDDAIHFFRSIALEIDQDPAAMNQYVNQPCISVLAYDRNSTCLARTKYLEALAYGDSGVLLACPGPSLSGLLLRELGSEAQKEYFFNYVESHKATTFFAVTEPHHGSDIASMQTKAVQTASGGYVLSGKKWLVGHGADALIGVVLSRISPGPLGIGAFLINHELLCQQSEKIERSHLDMMGLRGARLSQIIFHQLHLTANHFLGLHLRPVNRGMMALLKTFNRMRPCVSAFALGTAQAILDYLYAIPLCLQGYMSQFNELNLRIQLTRKLLYQAAANIDHNPFESASVSLVKIQASQLAEQCAIFSHQTMGVGALIEHPLLIKWQRDVFGYEYMEGTSIMQRKNTINLCEPGRL